MKNRVEVVIAGNRFTMTGEQDEEYMTKIAALVDNRATKIRESGAALLQAMTLTACDMADNYVQAVQGSENLRNQISSYLAENKSINQELSDAREEIHSLERQATARENEMANIHQFKDRISELEAQLAVSEKRKERISELEEKLSESQKRMQSAQSEAEARTRRVTELETRLAAADTRHQNDVQLAQRTAQELKELRDKSNESDKLQLRIEDLERELASTQRQLDETSTRLSRLLK